MKKYLIILKKELKVYLRDKRSLVAMLLPLLIIPLMLYASNQEIKNAENTVAKSISISTSSTEELADFISTLKLVEINVNAIESATPYDDLKTGKILLIIDKDETGYSIIFDQNSTKSAMALSVVTNIIEAQKEAYIFNIFNKYGESIENLNDYSYSYQDISAVDKSESSSFLALLAPTLLVMFIASGASSFAVDLFCGEKERGSLEAILATQVSRKSLYFAKVSTVFIFSCISAIISIMGYVVSFSFENSSMNGITLKMSPSQIIFFLLITLSFALFSAATISVLSVEAKTVKEGHLRTSLFSIVPSMLSIVTMYMQTGNMPFALNFVPFINTIAGLKSIFLNVIDPTNILIAICSTLLYSLVLLYIGYRVINSEKILNK